MKVPAKYKKMIEEVMHDQASDTYVVFLNIGYCLYDDEDGGSFGEDSWEAVLETLSRCGKTPA